MHVIATSYISFSGSIILLKSGKNVGKVQSNLFNTDAKGEEV